MIKFPPSTCTNAHITKTEIYRYANPPRSMQRLFIKHIEKITVCNSIKSATAPIENGNSIHEIIVLDVELRTHTIPYKVIEFLVHAMEGKKILFQCTINNEIAYAVRYRNRTWSTAWMDKESSEKVYLKGENLDQYWHSLCSYIIDGSTDPSHVQERASRASRRLELVNERAKINRMLENEKQIVRRNALFASRRAIDEQLEALKRKVF